MGEQHSESQCGQARGHLGGAGRAEFQNPILAILPKLEKETLLLPPAWPIVYVTILNVSVNFNSLKFFEIFSW